ncbi:uncharacterized protein LOC130496296 [Raphanus sativus]|uniref:Uncharacterized protein LOC130496296 n=1 Tax=Raphanus sativus TaxID=3726 RepID=A0A9W3BYA8_RAPSA|nr:uncharacterized protein LOC130496296 [Raphanus sativus]
MADEFVEYGGYAGVVHPYWLWPPYQQHPSVSTPPFLATPSSYDHPMNIPHVSYLHRSPSYGDNSRSPTPPPSSSQPVAGNHLGHGGEDACSSSQAGGYYPSMETPTSGVVYCPPMERQRVPPYSSATVSSLADMLIRNSQEPFYVPVPPSGVCATTSSSTYAFDLNSGPHESVDAAVSAPPYLRVPSMPITQGFFGENRPTGIRLGDGRSFRHNVSSHFPEYIQFGDATGHVKPLSENPDLCDGTGSRTPRSSHPLQFDAKSSLYHKATTLVADSENGSSLKNAIGDLNFDEQHESRNHCVVSSEGPSAPTMGSGAMKADNRNAAQSAVSYGAHSEGCANKSTGQSLVCDQGDFTCPDSSTRVSSVVNAMHNLSEVLVYECFSNRRSLLKPEQLEKIVENLTKCLKKITGDKTIASVPTQAIHESCPNVVDLNEAPNVVAEDSQGFDVKPQDSFGFKVKESVDKDKNEMTQSIKNTLASNFPDAYLARYHRIKNWAGNLKLQNRETSADASTFKQEPSLNPPKSVSIINKVEQETAEPLIKDGSTFGNNVVAMSHDAPQSSRFNTAPVDAVLSQMKQESPASTTEENHDDVIERFQILKHQETMRKLKSQETYSETMDEQEEDNPDASEMATIGRSSHMSDVMGRFQMLKRREAEQVQKPLNSVVDFDSDWDSEFESDSDSDQRCDYLLSDSMMTTGGNSQIETCANTEPSADGKGYESPTSDWEHVLKDD